VVARRIARHGGVHLLDDVAADAKVPELLLPPRRERPRGRARALGEAHRHELLETRGEEGPIAPQERLHFDSIFGGTSFECTIQGREALLSDFAAARVLDVVLLPGPELVCRELLRAPAEAVRDVVAIETELVSVTIDAADHDVCMRMFRVEMVHSCPFQ